MACNENIIKNIANEITRNCQSSTCAVGTDFVLYLIDLLLLNPKYGKMFTKTLKRKNLDFFVNKCVEMVSKCDTPVITLMMQHLVLTSYEKPQVLIDRHMESIETCVKPLVDEILEEDPEDNEEELKKLFRKISIFIVLKSGLGNPGAIVNLKEGMAALESVFSLDDLKVFVQMSSAEKVAQLSELLAIVSGVRLFNKDCKRGGDGITDLAFKLVDAEKSCLLSLSNSLMAVMQRVNTLTSAIENSVAIEEDTANIIVEPCSEDLTVEDYKSIYDMLAFNRQFETIIRQLILDVSNMVEESTNYVERFKNALQDLHGAVKYKAAVPVATVFPLFTKAWHIWRSMQGEMFLVSTLSKLISNLNLLQEQVKMPMLLVNKMLLDRQILSDQERMTEKISLDERLSLGSIKNYMSFNSDSIMTVKDRNFEYLGFCAICLCVGALVPCNLLLGSIKVKNKRYGFCNVKMAHAFNKDPTRYTNEVLDYVRNHPQLINLLNIINDIYDVKDIDNVVSRPVPKLKISDKDVQTEVHPIESYMKKDYSWNLWEWKRRACQWANIVKCQTHSTQTKYSHLRSEIHCQTVEPRDKGQQTNKDVGVNAPLPKKYIWGLCRLYTEGQGYIDLSEDMYAGKKMDLAKFEVCTWPCFVPVEPPATADSSINSDGN